MAVKITTPTSHSADWISVSRHGSRSAVRRSSAVGTWSSTAQCRACRALTVTALAPTTTATATYTGTAMASAPR